jgi:hypothetical protein
MRHIHLLTPPKGSTHVQSTASTHEGHLVQFQFLFSKFKLSPFKEPEFAFLLILDLEFSQNFWGEGEGGLL